MFAFELSLFACRFAPRFRSIGRRIFLTFSEDISCSIKHEDHPFSILIRMLELILPTMVSYSIWVLVSSNPMAARSVALDGHHDPLAMNGNGSSPGPGASAGTATAYHLAPPTTSSSSSHLGLDSRNLEIKTKSIEHTLVPLVTQVSDFLRSWKALAVRRSVRWKAKKFAFSSLSLYSFPRISRNYFLEYFGLWCLIQSFAKKLLVFQYLRTKCRIFGVFTFLMQEIHWSKAQNCISDYIERRIFRKFSWIFHISPTDPFLLILASFLQSLL